MKIFIKNNEEKVAEFTANLIKEEIFKKEDLKICFATGNSPILTYKNLIKMYENKEISFAKVTSFNLDEYVGVSNENPCSYHYFMYQNLFNHIDIVKKNINLPNGIGDIKKNSLIYEEKIKNSGGIDLMILGIGTNGHIAFNEPGSQIYDRTREVTLTESTIQSNKIYFNNENEVPKTAISMGIGTILEAKKILLIATGNSKAEAIKRMITEEISGNLPASFLRLHKDVTIILDEQAAKLLDFQNKEK
ncbi:glucosamine-6-phosphate deaminase [Mycoplasma sp. 613B]